MPAPAPHPPAEAARPSTTGQAEGPETAELRDPARLRRWGLLCGMLVLLWPLLVLTEFRPWQLLDPHSLEVTGRFLADFVPPRHDPEFLQLLLQESWRTIAIATAGLSAAIYS